MTRREQWRAAGARAALLACCALVAWSGVAQAAPRPPLSHSGRWITDARGRVVILHGFNEVPKSQPYLPGPAGFGKDDARLLRREGFNTVRLGLIYKGLEPRPGEIDDRYLDRVAQTVRLLHRRGIFVLLDFHQDLYNERFSGEGFPDWAVQDDGLPNEPDLGFPGNYVGMPALQRAYDHFWANDPGPGGTGLQNSYAAAWERTARRFAGERMLLGYDLMNEPFPGSVWQSCANPEGCPAFDSGPLTEFSRRVIAAIRRADPRSLVWYEPNVIFDFGAKTHHGDTDDARAGFSFHNYCLAAAPGLPAAPGANENCELGEQMVFDNAEAQSARTGDALLLSEFGATSDPVTLDRLADLADRNMVSWQDWTYAELLPGGQGALEHGAVIRDPRKPATPDNVNQGTLDVLARPYPEAVAGTPIRFGFDREARTFELVFSTRRVGGGSLQRGLPTEVMLPRRQYPRGYRATVRGGRVTSRRGARRLRVLAARGAAEVTVRVTPR